MTNRSMCNYLFKVCTLKLRMLIEMINELNDRELFTQYGQ